MSSTQNRENFTQNKGFPSIQIAWFIKQSFPLKVMVPYAMAFFLAIVGGCISISGQGLVWKFNLESIIAFLTLLLVNFYIRCIDEIKDLDYDRKHNPNRPLVLGTVRVKNVVVYAIVTFVFVAGLNLFLSVTLFGMIVFQMLYTALLLKLEKVSSTVANHLIPNFIVTHPVNIFLGIYLLLFVYHQNSLMSFHWEHAGLLLLNSLVFTYFELSRKTAWPEFANADEKLYSTVFGARNSAFLGYFIALFSCFFTIFLLNPLEQSGAGFISCFLPLLTLFPATINLIQFFQIRTKRYEKMRGNGIKFILSFYFSIIVYALLVSSPVLG